MAKLKVGTKVRVITDPGGFVPGTVGEIVKGSPVTREYRWKGESIAEFFEVGGAEQYYVRTDSKNPDSVIRVEVVE